MSSNPNSYLKVGLDVSQIVDGTGVSHYTTSLYHHLPASLIQPFAFSLTRSHDIQALIPSTQVLPIGRKFTHLLFNQLHLPLAPFISGINVIHTSDWTEPRSRLPKVTTLHDLTPFIYPHYTSPEIVRVHHRKLHWALQECRKFICVSTSTANDAMRLFHLSASRLEVIPEAPAENLTRLSPRPSAYSNYILAMGSRQPRKNIPRLISAYLAHRERFHFPPRLVITGENTLSHSDPHITFTGYVSDQELVNLIAGAEVFVYPSLYEGFGQPVLEAFYFGTPVVAGNTSSIPEVAGEAAILVDPLSEAALAKGIQTALSRRDDLISLGHRQVKRFSWATTAAATLAVYESIC